MHIFLSVLAALIAAYFLRNWWENRAERRAVKRMTAVLYPETPKPPSELRAALATVFALVIILIIGFSITVSRS